MTKKLKEVRIKAGLSQSELADKTELNIRMIQHYEQGVKNLNNAKLITLLKLCKELNCELKDILDDLELIKLLK